MAEVNDLLSAHLMLWGGIAFFIGIGAGLFATVDAPTLNASARDVAIVSRIWNTVTALGVLAFVSGTLRLNWINWDIWVYRIGQLLGG